MTPFDCIKCGKKHGMVVENMETGTQEPLDLCYDCLFAPMKYNPIPPHIKVDDIISGEETLDEEIQKWRRKFLKTETTILERMGDDQAR